MTSETLSIILAILALGVIALGVAVLVLGRRQRAENLPTSRSESEEAVLEALLEESRKTNARLEKLASQLEEPGKDAAPKKAE